MAACSSCSKGLTAHEVVELLADSGSDLSSINEDSNSDYDVSDSEDNSDAGLCIKEEAK